MTAIMVIRPDYEMAVRLWHDYAVKLISEAIKRGYEIIDKAGDLARQNEVFKDAPKAVLVIHNGHGLADRTAGQAEILWSVCNYPTSTIENKLGFFLSCLMGQQLLPDMVKKGLRAGIGWDETYAFNYAGQDPLTDPYLRLFFEPIVEGGVAILDKQPFGVWREIIISRYAENMKKCSCPDVQANLAWDANHCVLVGNGDATIPTAPPAPPPQPPQPPQPPKKVKVVYEGYIQFFARKFPIYLERKEVEEE